jgi:hypothetical protein
MSKVDHNLEEIKRIVANLDQRIIQDLKAIEKMNGKSYESKDDKGNNS